MCLQLSAVARRYTDCANPFPQWDDNIKVGIEETGWNDA
jgi:hypothetical protein